MFKKLHLRRVIFASFLITLLVIVSSSKILQKQPLNLVIISIDTLRPDHMGIYGYPKNTTPNIDTWAKKAFIFTNVRTVVPMTHPSFAALMTGRDPLNTRVISNSGFSVSENMKTLAEVLKERNYSTAAFLSGYKREELGGLNQGFDEINTHQYKSYYYQNGQELYKQASQLAYEHFVERAITWLDSQSQGETNNFFLWIHLLDPHAPYYPPENLRCTFNKTACNRILGKTFDELENERAKYQKCQDDKVPKDVVEMMESLYDGGIAYSDLLVGYIFKKLTEEGLDKNTLVVLYGDHGEGFDHNYYFNHRDVLYESSLKIPLIIKYPLASSSNKKSDRLIQNTDILPNLLDLLGIPQITPKVDGISFSDEFSNNPFTKLIPQRKRIYSFSINTTWTKFSISDGMYKFVYSPQESCLLNNQTEELYNLKNDPRETKNLLNEKKDIASKLRGRLLEQLSKYNLPIKDRIHIHDEDEKLPQRASQGIIERLGGLGY